MRFVVPLPTTFSASSSKFATSTGPATVVLTANFPPTANQWQPGSRMTTRRVVAFFADVCDVASAWPTVTETAAIATSRREMARDFIVATPLCPDREGPGRCWGHPARSRMQLNRARRVPARRDYPGFAGAEV